MLVDAYRVPVESRWFGLDRRRFPIAIFLIAAIAVMTIVLPAIDDAVSFDDPIKAGDVIDMGDGITLVPPVGWNLEDGSRVGQGPLTGVSASNSTAQLDGGGVVVVVKSQTFDGTAAQLLDQVNTTRDRSDAEPDRGFKATGSRRTTKTDSGIVGVEEVYTSAAGDGRLVAFTIAPETGSDTGTIGVTFTVDTSPDTYPAVAGDVDRMIASLTNGGTTS